MRGRQRRRCPRASRCGAPIRRRRSARRPAARRGIRACRGRTSPARSNSAPGRCRRAPARCRRPRRSSCVPSRSSKLIPGWVGAGVVAAAGGTVLPVALSDPVRGRAQPALAGCGCEFGAVARVPRGSVRRLANRSRAPPGARRDGASIAPKAAQFARRALYAQVTSSTMTKIKMTKSRHPKEKGVHRPPPACRPGAMLVATNEARRRALRLVRRAAAPAAGRSANTSRRKRNSAAGRPPVAVDISPVGSTSAALSTSRRKFCLCRCRPEIASTVRCNSVSVNSRGHQLEHHRAVFQLGAQPRDRGGEDAAMVEAHRLAERRASGARERRFAAVAPRLLDQARLVEQLVAVEHLLLVPGLPPTPKHSAAARAGRARDRARARRSAPPIRRAAAGSPCRGSRAAARANPPTGKSRYQGSKPAPAARRRRRSSGMRVSAR